MISILHACRTVPPPQELNLAERLGPGQVRAGVITASAALFGGISAEGQIGDLKIYYTPAAGNEAPTAATLKPLASAQGVSFGDVVKSIFSPGGGLGTLQIRSMSAENLSVAARTLVADDPTGTFGSVVPGFRSDRAANPGDEIFIPGLLDAGTSRTNLILQETRGTGASAKIEYLDTEGYKVRAADYEGSVLVMFGGIPW